MAEGIYSKIYSDVLTDAQIVAAGCEGFTMWAKATVYCRLHLTDGFIPESVLPLLGIGVKNPRKTADHLVAISLWQKCDGGYCFGKDHEGNDKWAKYQQTRIDIEKLRAYERERKRKQRGTADDVPHIVPPGQQQDNQRDDSETEYGTPTGPFARSPREPEPEPELRTPLSPAGDGADAPKQSQADRFVAMLPEHLQTPEVLEAIAANFRMRSQKRFRVLCDETLHTRAKDYAAFTADEIAEAFRVGTANQHQGVFPKHKRQVESPQVRGYRTLTKDDLTEIGARR